MLLRINKQISETRPGTTYKLLIELLTSEYSPIYKTTNQVNNGETADSPLTQKNAGFVSSNMNSVDSNQAKSPPGYFLSFKIFSSTRTSEIILALSLSDLSKPGTFLERRALGPMILKAEGKK